MYTTYDEKQLYIRQLLETRKQNNEYIDTKKKISMPPIFLINLS